jgi:hypothetical protein
MSKQNSVMLESLDREALVSLLKENIQEVVKETAKTLGYVHPENIVGKKEAAKMLGLNIEKKSWQVTMSQYMNIRYHDPALVSYRKLGNELQFKVKDVYAFFESKRHDPKDL